MRLFDNIVSSEYSTQIDGFYSLNEDVETLCLYYYKAVMPDKISELCSKKLDVHYSWITSCGLTNISTYELSTDDSIKTLKDFAQFQLGTTTV